MEPIHYSDSELRITALTEAVRVTNIANTGDHSGVMTLGIANEFYAFLKGKTEAPKA